MSYHIQPAILTVRRLCLDANYQRWLRDRRKPKQASSRKVTITTLRHFTMLGPASLEVM